jgi:pyrimidine-nucleoside phosphorylase
MRAVDIIQKKRDGAPLNLAEIDFFVAGATDGSWPDYQVSALLMAIVLRGMTPEETAWLTDAMVRSGMRLDLSSVSGVKVDKHSTGGVGDKTSLVLAPLVAACGARVPMMSGRGLGHTGGTLDKLESIPGFSVRLSPEEIRAGLNDIGCALFGQTSEIAPADSKLYALRDVTGTVESIPLISASIMSKKIAEGIDALVLDVKTGFGAFMKSEGDSRRLAQSLVDIGNRAGVRTEAIVTTMDAPLGRSVGNAVEIAECIETLKGRGPADLEELSILLAARMLVVAGIVSEEAEARRRVREALRSGAGVEVLRRVIERQGGDPRVMHDYDRLPRASGREIISASRDGYLRTLNAEWVGRASVALGAGRNRVDEAVDPAAGILVRATPGERVKQGQPLLELLFNKPPNLETARGFAEAAIDIGDEAPTIRPLVVERISSS